MKTKVLQHSLIEKLKQGSLAPFQAKIWKVLIPLFENLKIGQLSDKSSTDIGLGIDIFLKHKNTDFVLYISITEQRLFINSKYFDIYIYPEINTEIIAHLLTEILSGKYSIKLRYGKKERLIGKELFFESERLQIYNESKKFRFLTKKVEKEEDLKGIKLINY
ncbi:MAG: hypothetical protein HRT61_03935 [Ekhidna sp.]|nr:hypothetical protein [Ekhidna sp.]